MVIVECDGVQAAVDEEIRLVEAACREAGATQVRRAANEAEREDVWGVRRQLSLALRATGLLKINHDVVVPRGRVPQLLDAVGELAREYRLRVASFGHAGDGNIHVNLMVDKSDADELKRARQAERRLFERVVALEGSISGEHGIGFAKAPYLSIELSDRRDRAHETREGRVRSGWHSEPGKDLSWWWWVEYEFHDSLSNREGHEGRDQSQRLARRRRLNRLKSMASVLR